MSLRALTWAFDLDHEKITPTLKLVLITLANYANEQNETYPKQNTIAAKTMLSRQTVNTSLMTLESIGLIEVTRRFHENGGKRSSVYRLMVNLPQEPSINDDGPMSNKPTGGMSKAATSYDNDNNEGCQRPRRGMSNTATTDVGEPDMKSRILEPSQEPDSEPKPKPKKRRKTAPWPEDYREQFWNLYPRRKNTSKKAALDKLEKLEREDRVTFEAIMAGLRIYAERMGDAVKKDRKNEQFIAHATTWLNQERWETEEPGEKGGSSDAARSRIRNAGVFV
ncbi:helix-turn-helix domain-containing protein [Bradyrhizobium erythrophlei]|uniref:Helix-turn-helix domain-containing protein n=1 Tax=Bradyrhizobium erythrophlei TaxID=1437360 RepID=A0A1M5PQ53_9BRAD|nr:helix-turn-helix domain-containing protein [Bradyrhizobium erythrophlei]SHH03796.1 Helix-turn-helix domain-containing protein [Bradyrhizobium erythrophlei]